MVFGRKMVKKLAGITWEGWVDERDEMDTDELQALDNAIRPVRFLLTKVSHL
jgi:hypothetical protein